jgi:GT2 family glycosyltransferase
MNFDNNKVPVIGTAVMKNPFWVERLYKSIDFPVENFVIFNNNGKNEITQDLENLKKIENKFVDNIFISHLPANLGVSCAWNLIIKSYINSPYWIIVNDDVAFTDGLLEEMFISAKDKEIGMVHPYGGDFGQGAWDLFLMKDFVVQQCGLFDENLTPAYCEDADYIMRLHNSSIKKICGLTKNYLHGNGLSNEYYTHGSQTKRSNLELELRLNEINLINFEYLDKKWGKNWRTTLPTKLPFVEYPIEYTSFDLNFIRSKSLN